MKLPRGSTPASTQTPDPLHAWRGKALYLLLVVLAVGGLLAYGSTIANALVSGHMTPLLWVYAAVYLSFLLVAVLPRLDVPLRAWLVFILAYANAAASFARVGLAGSGRLYLVFIPAMAVILVGTRAGWTCLAISLGNELGEAAAESRLLGGHHGAHKPIHLGLRKQNQSLRSGEVGRKLREDASGGLRGRYLQGEQRGLQLGVRVRRRIFEAIVSAHAQLVAGRQGFAGVIVRIAGAGDRVPRGSGELEKRHGRKHLVAENCSAYNP